MGEEIERMVEEAEKYKAEDDANKHRRKKSLKRNKRSLRALHYQFYRRWVEVPEACQVVCLVVCPVVCLEACQVACLIWAVHLPLMIQRQDQPLKKLIKIKGLL